MGSYFWPWHFEELKTDAAIYTFFVWGRFYWLVRGEFRNKP